MEAKLAAGVCVEINPALVLLKVRTDNFQRRVIAIEHDDAICSRTGQADGKRSLFTVNSLTVALQMDLADFSRCELLLFVAQDLHVTTEIFLLRCDREADSIHRDILRHRESKNGFPAVVCLRKRIAKFA